MPSVAIVGVGRLGGALALALSRNGFDVKVLVHRDQAIARVVGKLVEPVPQLIHIAQPSPITSDIVLIATPDPEITSAVGSISARLVANSIVMHTSGSLSSDVLSGLRERSFAVGSFHPLASISDPILGAEKFRDAYICIEGDERAVDAATAMARALGGKPFSIDTKFKPLYHASAVMASGHFTALEDMAIEMLSGCGFSSEEAKKILMPLVRSTVENLEAQSSEHALTGTFARADVNAFERHLASLEDLGDDNIREVYLLLAARSLELAEKAGVHPARIDGLRKRVAIAKGNRR